MSWDRVDFLIYPDFCDPRPLAFQQCVESPEPSYAQLRGWIKRLQEGSHWYSAHFCLADIQYDYSAMESRVRRNIRVITRADDKCLVLIAC